MGVLFANSAKSKLAANLTSGATLLAIDEDDAWKFPSPTGGDWFPLTLFDAAGNIEYVKCTGRAAAILTIVRAQEGTTAKTFLAGCGVSHRLTAAALQAMRDTQSTALDVAVSALEDSISDVSGNVSELSGRIDAAVGAPPPDLNSLQKIAEAIGDDPDFVNTSKDASRLSSGTLADARLNPRLKTGGLAITDFHDIVSSGWHNIEASGSHLPMLGYAYMAEAVAKDADNIIVTAYSIGAEPALKWQIQKVTGDWGSWHRLYETEIEIQSVATGGVPTNTVIITASGTYSKPSGLKSAKFTVVGGGGGGGKGHSPSTGYCGCGGGGGGTAIFFAQATDIAANNTVIIGAGGAAGTVAAGASGGTTSIQLASILVQATGGGGGLASDQPTYGPTLGGPGGVGSNGHVNMRGTPGDAQNSSGGGGGNGGSSLLGGGGCAGGTSIAAYSEPGKPNSGGGGGGNSAGGSGVIIVEEYF